MPDGFKYTYVKKGDYTPFGGKDRSSEFERPEFPLPPLMLGQVFNPPDVPQEPAYQPTMEDIQSLLSMSRMNMNIGTLPGRGQDLTSQGNIQEMALKQIQSGIAPPYYRPDLIGETDTRANIKFEGEPKIKDVPFYQQAMNDINSQLLKWNLHNRQGGEAIRQLFAPILAGEFRLQEGISELNPLQAGLGAAETAFGTFMLPFSAIRMGGGATAGMIAPLVGDDVKAAEEIGGKASEIGALILQSPALLGGMLASMGAHEVQQKITSGMGLTPREQETVDSVTGLVAFVLGTKAASKAGKIPGLDVIRWDRVMHPIRTEKQFKGMKTSEIANYDKTIVDKVLKEFENYPEGKILMEKFKLQREDVAPPKQKGVTQERDLIGELKGETKKQQKAETKERLTEQPTEKLPEVDVRQDVYDLMKGRYGEKGAERISVNLTEAEAKYISSGGREGKEVSAERIDDILAGRKPKVEKVPEKKVKEPKKPEVKEYKTLDDLVKEEKSQNITNFVRDKLGEKEFNKLNEQIEKEIEGLEPKEAARLVENRWMEEAIKIVEPKISPSIPDQIKFKEYYEDVNNVPKLAEKIAKGEKLTTEDLQLQNNFPKELEVELQKLKDAGEPPKKSGQPKTFGQNLKEKIFNNLQWDKHTLRGDKIKAINQAKNDARRLREQGINAEVKQAGKKWHLYIDGIKQDKRTLGLVERVEKADINKEVENARDEAKKPYSELDPEVRDRQNLIMDRFVEASDLPDGFGPKAREKGLTDIAAGNETTPEAIIMREAAERIFNEGTIIRRGNRLGNEELSAQEIKDFIKREKERPPDKDNLDLPPDDLLFQQENMFGEGLTPEKEFKQLRSQPIAKTERGIVRQLTELRQLKSSIPEGTKKEIVKRINDRIKLLSDKLTDFRQESFEGLAEAKVPDKGIKGEGKGEESTPLFEKPATSEGQSGLFESKGKAGPKSMMSTGAKINPNAKHAESDLNNVTRLNTIGKNLALGANEILGQTLRTGAKILKRFGKMTGYFNPNNGLIRVRNMNDVKTIAHEFGHKLDIMLFKLSENYKFIKNDKLEKIVTMANGLKDAKRRDKVLNTLRQKHGAAIVDSILDRAEIRKELNDFLKRIGHYKISTQEGFAEYVSRYITDPTAIKGMTRVNQLWDNIIQTNPQLADLFHNIREQVKLFDKQTATQKTSSTIMYDEKIGGFIDGIRKLGDGSLIYNLVDVTYPFRKLTEKLYEKNPKLPGHKNPIIQVLSNIGIDGAAKQWLENHPVMRDIITGELKIRKDIKPFFKIFEQMLKTGTLKSHDAYFTALRNIELYKNHKGEGATTTLEIAKETVKESEAYLGKEYLDNLVKDLRKYNDALLEYYANSGKLSPEMFELVKKQNRYYVPFQRFFEEFEATGRLPRISKYINDIAATPSSGRVLKGSEREIVSPIGSMIKNTYDMLASAQRNITLDVIVDAMKSVEPSLVDLIPARTFKPVNVIAKPKIDPVTGEVVQPENFTEKAIQVAYEKPKGENIITVFKEGMPVYYQIPKTYYDAFFSIDAPMATAIRWLSKPSRLLQAGAVVYDPTFSVRNIFRDQVSAVFYSKYGYAPFDLVKGIFSAIKKDDAYQKFLASGADQSFLTAMDQMLSKEYMEQRVGARIQTTWQKYKRNPLYALQDLNRATELGSRVGAFKKALRKTGDPWLAMQEGREITADYGVKGKMMHNISPLYPFLNARIQHTKRIAETIKAHPLKTLTKGIVYISAPSAAIWFMNNASPERRELYQGLPTWRRQGLWNIPIPGTDSFLPIPKGYFGVLFGSAVEAALDWTLYNDPETIKEMGNQMFQEVSPLSSPAELMPQVGRPIIEQWANQQGFTGKPIVSESIKGLNPEDQYTDATSEFAKFLGSQLSLSPARIDAFISGYTAGAGKGLLTITDEALELAGIVEPSGEDTFTKLSRLPLTKAFFTETPKGTRSQYVQDFYKKLDELEETNRTINNFIKKNDIQGLDDYYTEDKKPDYEWYLDNQRQVNKFRDALSGTRELIRDIIKSKDVKEWMQFSEKKQAKTKRDLINEIQAEITDMAIAFNKAYDNKEEFDISRYLRRIMKEIKKEKKPERRNIERFKRGKEIIQ